LVAGCGLNPTYDLSFRPHEVLIELTFQRIQRFFCCQRHIQAIGTYGDQRKSLLDESGSGFGRIHKSSIFNSQFRLIRVGLKPLLAFILYNFKRLYFDGLRDFRFDINYVLIKNAAE
jgi:hypothetical protein